MNLRTKKRIRYDNYESDTSEFDEDYNPHDDEDNNDNNDNDEDYDTAQSLKNLKKTNSKAHDNFIEAKLEIEKNEPNIIKILSEPLIISDRAHLLQLYEIYKSTTPSTEEWLSVRNNLNKVMKEYKNNFKQYSKYTPQQHVEMKEQIELLEKYNPAVDLQYKILQLNTSVENKRTIYNKYKELCGMDREDYERGKLIHWINWAVSIPHDNIKTFPFTKNQLTNFLRHVSKTLDKELYGMDHVKEQILLFVSTKIQNPNVKRCSLGLIGPPGVGKTAISRLLAQVLNFPFEQISLGGISNPDYLKGHAYTYVGSQPGEIVKCMKRMEYKNGILFLDEFDKISDNKDICSALLHITDPVQNSEFRDKFLADITIDLSYLWFVYSMNELPVDSALRDRIYTIEVPGYELQDKICIIIDYLFPKALRNINLPENFITLTKNTAKYLIQLRDSWEQDPGVRTIEKDVNNITSKIDFLVKHQDKKGNLKGFNISFNTGNVLKYPVTLTSTMIDILF